MIDGDEATSGPLVRALQGRGYEVDVRGEAREGFSRACESIPDAVVCALDLPDIDGFWVARRIRTEGGFVAKTPFMFVAEGDRESRVQGLSVGADVFVARPVTDDEIVAQVDALIALVRRLRRDSILMDETASGPPSMAAAFRGDIGTFPIASILMMLELERRTGTLDIVSPSGTRATFSLNQGLFAETALSGQTLPPIEALRQVLGWRAGKFAFRPREIGSVPPPRGSVGAMVLEAMRLDDEEAHAAR